MDGKSTDGIKTVQGPSVLFDASKFRPLDPTQEPTFPPALKAEPLIPLAIKGPRVSWYRPLTLDQLLVLRAKFPKSKLVCGNTEIGGWYVNCYGDCEVEKMSPSLAFASFSLILYTIGVCVCIYNDHDFRFVLKFAAATHQCCVHVFVCVYSFHSPVSACPIHAQVWMSSLKVPSTILSSAALKCLSSTRWRSLRRD